MEIIVNLKIFFANRKKIATRFCGNCQLSMKGAWNEREIEKRRNNKNDSNFENNGERFGDEFDGFRIFGGRDKRAIGRHEKIRLQAE